MMMVIINMKVYVSCSSENEISSTYKEVARKLGEKLSEKETELVFGSSTNGLMGIIYQEYLKRNQKITVVVPEELIGNLTEVKYDQKITVKNVLEQPRKLIMASDVMIALPGGIGTITEITTALMNNKLCQPKPLIILNVNHFFDLFLEFLNHQVKEKTLKKEDLKYLYSVNEIESVIKLLEKLDS